MVPDNKPAPPTVTGQCAQVLGLIREQQPVLSFTLTADHAIAETAARVHDLRAAVRRNVASYSLGSPEWPRPGFLDGANDAGQLGLDLGLRGEQ